MNLNRSLKTFVEWIANEREDGQLWERLAQDLLKKFWNKNRLFWYFFNRPELPVAKRLWGCYWGILLRRREGSPESPKPFRRAGSCREPACASWTSSRFCNNFAIIGLKALKDFLFFTHLPKSCLNSFWNERSKCRVSAHLWYKVLRWG